MARPRWRLASVAALGMFTGCTEPHPTPSPLAGNWVAEIGGQVAVAMQLTASDSMLTGTGTLGGLASTSQISLAITGRYVEPGVALSFEAFSGTMTFTGTRTDRGIVGSLSGLGFMNTSATFRNR